MTSENVQNVVPEMLPPLIGPQAAPRKYELVYTNILVLGYMHLAAIYGMYLCFTSAYWPTLFINWFMYLMSAVGVTAGAHRLWSHKSYKAKLPLQIILMLMNSVAFQGTVLFWVREHRMHHKYTDTDADTHNSTRGLFFSHIGWLFVRKHEEAKKRVKFLDMSDVNNNPVLQFQQRYTIPLIGMLCFILPTAIPMYFWGESLNNAWHVTIMRYILCLNITFLINSAGHHEYGYKPYDKSLTSTDAALFTFLTAGEGSHNYHHVFPWDYRTNELGTNFINLTTLFIDFFAKIGWAYDLKTAPQEIIVKRAMRTGDGSRWDSVEKNDLLYSK